MKNIRIVQLYFVNNGYCGQIKLPFYCPFFYIKKEGKNE